MKINCEYTLMHKDRPRKGRGGGGMGVETKHSKVTFQFDSMEKLVYFMTEGLEPELGVTAHEAMITGEFVLSNVGDSRYLEQQQIDDQTISPPSREFMSLRCMYLVSRNLDRLCSLWRTGCVVTDSRGAWTLETVLRREIRLRSIRKRVQMLRLHEALQKGAVLSAPQHLLPSPPPPPLPDNTIASLFRLHIVRDVCNFC